MHNLNENPKRQCVTYLKQIDAQREGEKRLKSSKGMYEIV